MTVDLGSIAPSGRSREVRLGLVMYGGVSLAIYINGVAREFFRAVHGNGVYKLLKRLIDSDIVVDIISGTSAGGINGLFLAFALANGKRFEMMADLWRNVGDISALLRDPEHLPPDVNSVLDSEGYYQKNLVDAFQKMYGRDYDGTFDEPSPMPEIDVFITGTNLHGDIYTVFDDFGHAIDVKEHRTVFQLKHRRRRKEPFNPHFTDPVTGTPLYEPADSTYTALATLARLTSCFPAAFAPVHIPGPDQDTPAAKHLRMWGALRKEAYFLDGGVLDNKPFSHTIRDMASRTKQGPTERVLFYVEPDPERFEKELTAKALARPSFFKSAISGAVTIPSYESISDDLRLIADYNSGVEKYRTLAAQLTTTKKVKSAHPVLPRITEECVCESQVYLTARLAQLRDRALQGILRRGGEDRMMVGDERARAEDLVNAFDDFEPHDDEEYKIPGASALVDFDVYFRQRRLIHLAETLQEAMKTSDSPALRNFLAAVNRSFKLHEIFRFWMEKLVDEMPLNWKAEMEQASGGNGSREARLAAANALWEKVRGAFQRLLDPEDEDTPITIPAFNGEVSPLTQEVLNTIHAQFRARLAKVISTPFAEARSRFHGLFEQADRLERAMVDFFGRAAGETAVAAYDSFVAVDTCLFPLQYYGGLEERERIMISRISPADARLGLSSKSLEEKVAGDDLGHFSGFFKKSWRSNDILWGRLDALSQMVECLLTPERLRQLSGSASWQAGLQQIDRQFLEEVFPHATTAQRDRLHAWIQKLIANPAAEAANAPVEEIVKLGQVEILHEEVPRVLADAASEEAIWEKPTTSATVANATARQLGAQWANSVAEPPTSKVPADGTVVYKAFDGEYSVGSERVITHIPAIVRLEIVLRAARVALQAVRNSAKTSQMGAAIAGNKLLRFGGLVLNVLGRFFSFARYDHSAAVVLFAAVLAFAFAGMVIGVVWRDPLIQTKDGINWSNVVVFFVLPLAVILVTSWILKLLNDLRKWRLRAQRER